MSARNVRPTMSSERPLTEDAAPHRTTRVPLLPPWRGRPVDMALRVAVMLLLGLLAAGIHYLVSPPAYSASTLVSVVPKAPGPRQAPMESLMQVRYSQALARVAMTVQVAAPALREAGLEDMSQAPKRHLTTSAAPDTAVFTVTSRADTPGRAVRAVSAVAAGIREQAQRRDLPVTMSFDPPVSASQASPRLFMRAVLGGSVGVALGVIWVLLLLDQRWTSPRRVGNGTQRSDKEME